jgi:hypothetical protein
MKLKKIHLKNNKEKKKKKYDTQLAKAGWNICVAFAFSRFWRRLENWSRYRSEKNYSNHKAKRKKRRQTLHVSE